LAQRAYRIVTKWFPEGGLDDEKVISKNLDGN